MTRPLLSAITVLSLLAIAPERSSANDIVDFLRALSGPPQIPHQYHGYDHELRQQAARPERFRYDSRFNPRTNQFVERQRVSGRFGGYPTIPTRTNSSFTIGFGQSPTSCQLQQLRPQPLAPVPPQHVQPLLQPPPAPGSFGHLPHQLGEIVTCQVPLATCVEVRQACRIAPNAVPIVVAVRDPHIGRFRKCVEQLAYVEVCVPPCPVRRVKISPCRTRVRLDYGRYAVNILSRNGRIIVDYDG